MNANGQPPVGRKAAFVVGLVCVILIAAGFFFSRDHPAAGIAILTPTGLGVLWLLRLLCKENNALRAQIAEHMETAGALRWRAAFLEANMDSSLDGILVVDRNARKILQNQRMSDLWKIPPHIAADPDDRNQVKWVTGVVRDAALFAEKIVYLNSHPDEISRDEIALKDGTVLDRYSSPVTGDDGTYYGRIWTFRDITARKQTEQALRLLESAVEHITDSVLITDASLDLPGPAIIFVNPAFTRMTGYTGEEVIGKTPRILQGPRTDAAVLRRLREDLARGEVFGGETVNYRKDGTEFDLEWQISPICNSPGAPVTHYVAIQRDITRRKSMEARLFQSQKMETVGKLAGGIAHEFNSIMTAIIGQSELILGDLPAENPLRYNAMEIRLAADRVATLTRQLLAYGRKQILQPEILDLNAVVLGMETVLRHLMSLDVDVRVVPNPGLKSVKADAGQIEQVILNIAMNAAEAMPNGGRLTLETANVTFDDQYVSRFPDLKAGEYVMAAISDTGAGMSEAVRARVFEPFFSTKGVGSGTGLGLSTCHGILKQSGGHIEVYSEPGRGSTFKIYLPQITVPVKSGVTAPAPPPMPSGRETLLLVEDDSALREMAATLLRKLGYTVWAAANGIEALELTNRKDSEHIDLLFTDVVMPHMSGRELSDRIHASYPLMKILFTSAYTENSIVHQGVLDEGIALLPKPFTPSALALKIREILDGKSHEQGAAQRQLLIP